MSCRHKFSCLRLCQAHEWATLDIGFSPHDYWQNTWKNGPRSPTAQKLWTPEPFSRVRRLQRSYMIFTIGHCPPSSLTFGMNHSVMYLQYVKTRVAHAQSYGSLQTSDDPNTTVTTVTLIRKKQFTNCLGWSPDPLCTRLLTRMVRPRHASRHTTWRNEVDLEEIPPGSATHCEALEPIFKSFSDYLEVQRPNREKVRICIKTSIFADLYEQICHEMPISWIKSESSFQKEADQWPF